MQRIYGDSVLVFYDDHGGRVIGLLWNPTKEVPRALKPLLGHSSRPTDGEVSTKSAKQTSSNVADSSRRNWSP